MPNHMYILRFMGRIAGGSGSICVGSREAFGEPGRGGIFAAQAIGSQGGDKDVAVRINARFVEAEHSIGGASVLASRP
jgi:hypothetical protein